MNLSVILFIVTTGVVIIVFGKLYSNLILKINYLKKENSEGHARLRKIEVQQKEEDRFLANVLSHPRIY